MDLSQMALSLEKKASRGRLKTNDKGLTGHCTLPICINARVMDKPQNLETELCQYQHKDEAVPRQYSLLE